jgi:hypothetical protein
LFYRNYPYGSNTNGYSYNNSNNGHSHAKHGSIDEQPRSPDEGFPTGPDPSSSFYSTSAPSPSMGPQSPTIRVKRREVFPYQESPYFYPTQQLCNLFSPDQSMRYEQSVNFCSFGRLGKRMEGAEKCPRLRMERGLRPIPTPPASMKVSAFAHATLFAE